MVGVPAWAAGKVLHLWFTLIEFYFGTASHIKSIGVVGRTVTPCIKRKQKFFQVRHCWPVPAPTLNYGNILLQLDFGK